MAYGVECICCGETVSTTVEQIGDLDGLAMFEHLRACHPQVLSSDEAPDLRELLRYFSVTTI